jgi:hypothetical protein
VQIEVEWNQTTPYTLRLNRYDLFKLLNAPLLTGKDLFYLSGKWRVSSSVTLPGDSPSGLVGDGEAIGD